MRGVVSVLIGVEVAAVATRRKGLQVGLGIGGVALKLAFAPTKLAAALPWEV